MPVARIEHKGAAAELTLSADISSSATSITTTGTVTGWPSGSTGLFYIVIDPGNSSEEKVRCLSRSGNTITVDTGGRGADDTTAVAHVAGAKIRHVYTALEADAANEFLSLPAAKGDLAVASAADTWAKQTVGSDDTLLMADAAQTNGVKWAASAAPSGAFSTSASVGTADTWLRSDAQFNLFDTTAPENLGTAATGSAAKAARRDHVHSTGAWTSYSPTWASVGNPQPAIGNGTLTGRYLLIGKLLFIRIQLVAGTTTTFGNSEWSFTLPSVTTIANKQVLSAWGVDNGTSYYPGVALCNASSTKIDTIHINANAFGIKSDNPFTWASGDELAITGAIEIA